jgi:hypothetical protein
VPVSTLQLVRGRGVRMNCGSRSRNQVTSLPGIWMQMPLQVMS